MEKHRKHNRFVVAAVAAAFIAALAAPASAGTATGVQTVDATLAETLSFTLSTPSVTGWALDAENTANTISAGTATVSGNGLTFTITVLGEKAFLTEHDGTAYVTGGKALAAPMTVTASQSAVPAGTTAVGTTASALIAAGTSLAGTDQSYDLQFSQATTLADAALPTGRTYHNQLTYTVTSAL